MSAALIAIFFAAAAAFAVLSIGRAFADASERIDALFEQHRAMGSEPVVRAVMFAPARFVPAPAPNTGKVVIMPRRSGAQLTDRGWRAAA